MANKKLREDIVYEQKYGMIPNDLDERIAYILGKKADNKKVQSTIERLSKKIKGIKQCKYEFTMWKVMKPSRRPRVNTRGGFIQMYVPQAAENGKWFENFAQENDLPKITTPCVLNMVIYEKTPTIFNMKQKVLAELGIIKPWRRSGDFDNYAKAVADAIQHGMLEDDALVYESTILRRYSIKPHVKIEVIYYETFPSCDIPGGGDEE